MRYLFLVLLSLISSGAIAGSCEAPAQPLRDLMKAEWGAEPDELDPAPVRAGQATLELIIISPSCGLRGCDFSLAHAVSPGCYRLAGNFFGRATPKAQDDWSEFTVRTRSSSAAGPVFEQSALYRLDAGMVYRAVTK